MRRRWRIVLLALALGAAAALAVIGISVLDVGARTRADDLVLANAAGSFATEEHGRSATVRLGESILGVGDDRAFRDAVAIAKAAQTQRGTAVLELRARAEAILFRLVRTSGDDALRSRASNLLGTLLFEDAKVVLQNPRSYLEQALGAFQDAVRFDPSNIAAKTNLEILATLRASTRFRHPGKTGETASATPSGGGGY